MATVYTADVRLPAGLGIFLFATTLIRVWVTSSSYPTRNGSSFSANIVVRVWRRLATSVNKISLYFGTLINSTSFKHESYDLVSLMNNAHGLRPILLLHSSTGVRVSNSAWIIDVCPCFTILTVVMLWSRDGSIHHLGIPVEFRTHQTKSKRPRLLKW